MGSASTNQSSNPRTTYVNDCAALGSLVKAVEER